MTIKTIVYCELGSCEEHAIIGYEKTETALQPPWLSVKAGSATWARHFCSVECLRTWADSEILRRPLQNVVMTGQFDQIKKKDQPARDIVSETLAKANEAFCQWPHCDRPAVNRVEYETAAYRYCQPHTETEIVVLTRMGVTYERSPL